MSTPGQIRDALGAHVRRRLRTIDAALHGWRPGTPEFDAAVAETVSRHGYAPVDVERQLLHVAHRRCTGAALADALGQETAGEPVRGRAPREVLQLVAATVPGLAMESLLVAYTLGARSQIRPAREETVLAHFLAHASGLAPALVGSVELVPELRWATADAAIVYGSDETVALVRSRLGEDCPLASYGSREGISVVTPDADAEWAGLVADDVMCFGQRGCMSPSHLFVLGAEADARFRSSQLREALIARRAAHMAASSNQALDLAERAAQDDETLAAIAGGAEVIHVPPARLTVHRARDAHDLGSAVARLGGRLQTAVLACAAQDRSHLTAALLQAGCSRVCLPGEAHLPPADWPHDGIGRFAPLLAPAAE